MKLRVLLHDFGGYGFIAGLSRALAGRGHDVLHAYCGSVQTPQGALERQAGDAAGLGFERLDLPQQIRKRSLVKRWRQERQYTRLLLDLVDRTRPDVVVSANTPSQVQARLSRKCRQRGTRVVSWVQDLYGVAAYDILRRKVPVVGGLVGRHFMRLDRQSLHGSDGVVLISDAFRQTTRDWGVPDDRTSIIPNWGALDDLPRLPKDNAWSRKHGLHDHTCLLYSGTLAMKHNPRLLLALARRFRDRKDVKIAVVSEGFSADWLAAMAAGEGLTNLLVLPFQPYDELPQVLASADVLVSVLEPEAGRFSVPSKVLTYMCAGRAILLGVPRDNLAAQTVLQADAGLVASPKDEAAFVAAAEQLVVDESLRRRMADDGRRYAETHFDMRQITDQFEAVLKRVGKNSNEQSEEGPRYRHQRPGRLVPRRAPAR